MFGCNCDKCISYNEKVINGRVPKDAKRQTKWLSTAISHTTTMSNMLPNKAQQRKSGYEIRSF